MGELQFVHACPPSDVALGIQAALHTAGALGPPATLVGLALTASGTPLARELAGRLQPLAGLAIGLVLAGAVWWALASALVFATILVEPERALWIWPFTTLAALSALPGVVAWHRVLQAGSGSGFDLRRRPGLAATRTRA